jgi:Flp pilus assembly secretin CpaC
MFAHQPAQNSLNRTRPIFARSALAAALVAATALSLQPAPALAQQPADTPAPAQSATPPPQQAPTPVPANAPMEAGEPQTLHLLVGRSIVITSPARIRRVSIADPTIAEAIVVSPNQVLVNGKTPGGVSLIIWDESDQSQSF